MALYEQVGALTRELGELRRELSADREQRAAELREVLRLLRQLGPAGDPDIVVMDAGDPDGQTVRLAAGGA